MFILRQGKVDIEPKALFIPEFNAIWERDRTKSKITALNEFAYVYFMADYKSEYNIYGLEKPGIIAMEIFGDSMYHPDEVVNNAILRYEQMQETYSMKYLRSIRGTVDSLMKFYEDLRYKSKTTNVTQYDPSQVTKAMKEVETVLEKIEKWERKVRGEEDMMKIRGGGKIGMFEDKESATWLRK
jgi:hypothetical protein